MNIDYFLKLIFKRDILEKSINSLIKSNNSIIDLYNEKRKLDKEIKFIKKNYTLIKICK